MQYAHAIHTELNSLIPFTEREQLKQTTKSKQQSYCQRSKPTRTFFLGMGGWQHGNKILTFLEFSQTSGGRVQSGHTGGHTRFLVWRVASLFAIPGPWSHFSRAQPVTCTSKITREKCVHFGGGKRIQYDMKTKHGRVPSPHPPEKIVEMDIEDDVSF